MVREPLVVNGQFLTSIDLLVTSDLQPMQMCQMSFGADMSEEMGHITEIRFLGADGTFEEVRSHLEERNGV